MALLDSITGVAAAWDFRNLKTSYAGAAIRVKNTTTNVETDLAQNFTKATADALGTDLQVVKLYDLTGNGNTEVYQSGSATLKFDGESLPYLLLSNAVFKTASALALTAPKYFDLINFDGVSSNAYIHDAGDNQFVTTIVGGIVRLYNGSIVNFPAIVSNTWNQIAAYFQTGTDRLFVNGTEKTATSGANAGDAAASGVHTLFNYGGGSLGFTGKWRGSIIIDGAVSDADRQAIADSYSYYTPSLQKIDAGGAGAGAYAADTGFSGGSTVTVANTFDVSDVTNAAPAAVYNSIRFGANFSRTFGSLAPGNTYYLRIHAGWYDTNAAFYVNANGVLKGAMDFVSPATDLIIQTLEFTAEADAGGEIVLDFHAIFGSAFLNALEINTVSLGGSTPVPAYTQSLTCEGDSITVGYPDASGNSGYPQFLRGMLPANWRVRNVAHSGDTIFANAADAPLQIDQFRNAGFSRDVATVFFGTNDLGTLGRTAVDIYADLTDWISDRKALGFETGIATILARADALWNPTKEAERAALNVLIRQNSAGADFVVDTASLPEFASPADTRYYDPDQIHLAPEGEQALADAFYTAVMGIPPPNPDFIWNLFKMPNHYSDISEDFEAITYSHPYDDGGKTFNTSNDVAPYTWQLVYTKLTPAVAAAFDEHFTRKGIAEEFTFYGKHGVVIENVRYKSYKKSHDEHKSFRKTRVITFEKLP